ncbi:hypothetical protein HDU92_007276 [Lobulomyces angularis]|nr:hypothetical protein HDU92_007276 [Lobulomyces angularis]
MQKYYCEAPSGVFNVVPGLSEVGETISDHPDIDKISFTGSPEIGKIVLEASSKSNLKRVTLELGGKGPIIVFDVANLHRAGPVFGAFCSNMGQNCVAGSRLYLHEKIYDEFLNLLKERISQVKIGESSDKSKNFGPLVSKSQFEKVKSFFSHAEKNKINCLTGGRTHERLEKGFFVEPTVYFNVKEDDLLATKEVFGPILSVLKPFNNFDEVIQRANDTCYGLGAAIFTNDIKKADRFVNEIRAGTIWVNTYNICDPFLPFGGIKGMSGFGKDMGRSCLDEYTVEKSVMYDMN